MCSKCKCGKKDKCPREVKATPEGKMYVINHFSCEKTLSYLSEDGEESEISKIVDNYEKLMDSLSQEEKTEIKEKIDALGNNGETFDAYLKSFHELEEPEIVPASNLIAHSVKNLIKGAGGCANYENEQ